MLGICLYRYTALAKYKLVYGKYWAYLHKSYFQIGDQFITQLYRPLSFNKAKLINQYEKTIFKNCFEYSNNNINVIYTYIHTVYIM